MPPHVAIAPVGLRACPLLVDMMDPHKDSAMQLRNQTYAGTCLAGAMADIWRLRSKSVVPCYRRWELMSHIDNVNIIFIG